MSIGGVLFMTSVVVFFPASQVAAQDDAEMASSTPERSTRAIELQQNISDHQSEIKILETEIAQYKEQLVSVGTQKTSLQNTIKTIDLTRGKLTADTKLTEAKIAQSRDTIAQISGSINKKEVDISNSKRLIADIIQQIDQVDAASLPEMILTKRSLSEFLQDIDDMARLQLSIREHIISLRRLKDELGEQKITYQGQQDRLLKLSTQLRDQKRLADQQRTDKNALLKDTKNLESNYKKLLADKEARKKLFEREIDDFEAQLRSEIDPNSFPKPGTKVLAYPLDDVLVTQKFGKTVDSVRLYAAGTHNGIDFRAAPGTPIKSAGDGIVVGTGDTDKACKGASYGRWILIEHKNGLSTMYSHFDMISVSQGQSVNVGDVIGYSGTTGYATGPHLHFGVFVSSATQIVDLPSKSCAKAVFHIPVAPVNAYLDPQAYL